MHSYLALFDVVTPAPFYLVHSPTNIQVLCVIFKASFCDIAGIVFCYIAVIVVFDIKGIFVCDT